MKTPSKILAHRGFSSRYPENTRIAFRKALELPIDGLEFDVQLTRDEIPVVIHDELVNRTTDGGGAVSSMTLSELRNLNAGVLHPDAGFQPIPTLKEVLDIGHGLTPDGLFNIEIKGEAATRNVLVDSVISVLEAHVMKNHVLISSFHHGCLCYLKERYETYPIGLLFEENVPEPWYRAKQMGAYSVHLNQRYATNETIEGCRQNGIRTAMWTVDERAAMERFMGLAVDVLITNVPEVALDVKQKG